MTCLVIGPRSVLQIKISGVEKGANFMSNSSVFLNKLYALCNMTQ